MSVDHIPGERGVKYFGRFDTCLDSYHYTELQEFKVKKHPKEIVLAAALLAKDFNNGEYVKGSNKSYDYISYHDEDGNEGTRYLMTRDSNRDIVIAALMSFPGQITEKLIEQARSIIMRLELEFMFKVLSDNMNEFERGVHSFIANDEVTYSDIGIVAYVPFYDKREEDAKSLRDRSALSAHIGTAGGVINAEIEIINQRKSEQFGGYNVSAITTDGNRVSFFTSKDEIATRTGVFKINAKVKSFGSVWREPDIKETRLNYVKFA
jgi:hypothetical protein